MIITALVFFLLLSVLVLIHELGHFLVAKKLNIKVEEFGFGLPPRLWGIKQGETMYSINWLPIGGFVKLFGEDDAGAGKVSVKKSVQAKAGDSKRAFFARPVRERAAVVVAGVVMNALLAIVIFYVYLGIAGFKAELPLIGDHKFFLANEQVKTDVVISAIQKESPAEKAQIPEFAKVVAVNGKAISSIEDFTSRVKALQGKEIALSFIDPKSNKTVTKRIVPRSSPPKGQGALGVNLFGMNTVILTYDSSLQKVLSGITYPANLLSYNFDLLGKLVQSAIKNRDAGQLGEGVAGPVGIYSLVGTIVQIPDIKEKVLQILNLAGILSISLAFFNILPIPALDGGRLFFILIEGIFRKKVNPKYETIAHTVGMAILLFLILLITFNDVLKIL